MILRGGPAKCAALTALAGRGKITARLSPPPDPKLLKCRTVVCLCAILRATTVKGEDAQAVSILATLMSAQTETVADGLEHKLSAQKGQTAAGFVQKQDVD